MNNSRQGVLLLVSALLLSCPFPASAAQSTDTHGISSSPFREGKLFKGNVSYRVSRGENQLLTGSYEKAETAFRQAIARNPRDVRARAGLGFTLAMQFKLDGADDQINRALSIAPKDPMARTAKALVLLHRLQSSSGSVIKARQAILAEAESNCRQAISADSQMPEARFMLGSVLKEQGRLEEAAKEFAAACQLDVHYSAAYAALGLTDLALNRIDQAKVDFKHAIAIRSKNSTAHYGLGKLYLRQGNADAAVKELNTALYLNRNSAPVQLALGESYAMQGNTVGALKAFQESIRIKPEMPESYLRIAEIRESRGDLEHAIAEIRSGLAMNPDSPELNSRVGELSLRAEKLDDAIKGFKTALAFNPGDSASINGLTTALYLKTQKEGQSAIFSDDFESAQQQIQEAISLSPNNMLLRLADARLRALSGQSVDLNSMGAPANDGERIAYAQALMGQNRFEDATKEFNILIANAPDSTQTFAIADLAQLIKDLSSAESAYNKAKSFPGAEARAKRGLANIAKLRQESHRHLMLARDFSRKGMTNSAIDQYRTSIYNNPKEPLARIELAELIQKQSRQDSSMMRDAAHQYRAYLALSPHLTPKERNKFEKRVASLEEKAIAFDQKNSIAKRSEQFLP